MSADQIRVRERLTETLLQFWEKEAGEPLNPSDLGVVGDTLCAYTDALAPVVNDLMQQAWNEGYGQAIEQGQRHD